MRSNKSNSEGAIVRTLLVSGFHIEHVYRSNSYLLFRSIRADEFGVTWKYLIGYSGNNTLSKTEVESLKKVASVNKGALIVVGSIEAGSPDVPCISLEDFTRRLGGIVSSYLPLEPDFIKRISELGLNSLPEGLSGKPDNLFEAYVQAGLQFLLHHRVIRYGQDRLFEPLPDGVAFGRDSLVMLYDCKAAAEGYDVTIDSIRQFSDYVDSFHERYESYVGRIHTFLVVSGKFNKPNQLAPRSKELYVKCGVPISFMTAKTLGLMALRLAKHPAYRQAIDWRTVFADPTIEMKVFNKNLKARIRDQIIRG